MSFHGRSFIGCTLSLSQACSTGFDYSFLLKLCGLPSSTQEFFCFCFDFHRDLLSLGMDSVFFLIFFCSILQLLFNVVNK